MNQNPVDPSEQRLRQLRDAFDSSFARPWMPARAEPNAILCFTVGAHSFAAPLTELQSIAKAGPIIHVPSRSPALLGLTVVRAKLMPVYSLAALLDVSAAPPEICWLAILRGRLPAALALDSLDGYADRQSVLASAGGATPQLVKGSVRYRERLHALLDCAGIYDAITRDAASLIKDQDPTP